MIYNSIFVVDITKTKLVIKLLKKYVYCSIVGKWKKNEKVRFKFTETLHIDLVECYRIKENLLSKVSQNNNLWKFLILNPAVLFPEQRSIQKSKLNHKMFLCF